METNTSFIMESNDINDQSERLNCSVSGTDNISNAENLSTTSSITTEVIMDISSDEESGTLPSASKTSDLHRAVKYGNATLVKQLLQRRVDVNAQDSAGNTPLHVAVTKTANAKLEIIKLLLQYQADRNLQNNRGESASFFVQEMSNLFVVPEPELVYQASLSNSGTGKDFLLFAVKFGSLSDVECQFGLSKNSALSENEKLKKEKKYLLKACHRGNFPIVKFLLQHIKYEYLPKGLVHKCVAYTLKNNSNEIDERKSIINALLLQDNFIISQKDNEGDSPLAKINIHLELIKFLLENGANLRQRDNMSHTCLMRIGVWISGNDLDNLFVYLIDKYPNIREVLEDCSSYGTSVLRFLIQTMTQKTLQLVSSLGIDFSNSCLNNEIVLHSAIECGRDAVFIDALVSMSLHAGTGNGKDLICVSARLANVDAMRYFLSKGYDVNTIDKEGFAPLQLLLKSRKETAIIMEGVRCLVENGAKLTYETFKDIPVLFEAIRGRRNDENVVKLIKYLVYKGADVHQVYQGDLNAIGNYCNSTDSSEFHGELNIMFYAAYSFNRSQFHELAKYFAESGADKLFLHESKTNAGSFNALDAALHFMKPPMTDTLNLFKVFGVHERGTVDLGSDD